MSRRDIALADAVIGQEECDAVASVLKSRWLSMGEQTHLFEREFSVAHGTQDAVAVGSGTAALHLAFLALGLGRGDEVVMPSLSFVAAAEVVTLLGGKPVFADSRSDRDLTVDPRSVARLLTARTKAVVAMHYGGYPADLAALTALCRERGVVLVEDAAHAPMVQAGDGMLGAIADIGCFSFFASKNLTTGEGGMVVARSPALLERVRRLRSHAISRDNCADDADYDVTDLGLNYRPTEIAAAIGRVQLRRLTRDRAHRHELVARYLTELAAVPGLTVPFAGHAGDSAYHLMAVVLPRGTDRGALRADLRRLGVQTSVHYPPTHSFSFYRRRFGEPCLPVVEDFAPRLLSLPLHARMEPGDVSQVTACLRESLALMRSA
jgi:dTDP-4-amino-4,6-dideoxygalactose transaminase